MTPRGSDADRPYGGEERTSSIEERFANRIQVRLPARHNPKLVAIVERVRNLKSDELSMNTTARYSGWMPSFTFLLSLGVILGRGRARTRRPS